MSTRPQAHLGSHPPFLLLFLVAIPQTWSLCRFNICHFTLRVSPLLGLPDTFHSGIRHLAFFCAHRVSLPSSAFRDPDHQTVIIICFLLLHQSISEENPQWSRPSPAGADAHQLHPAWPLLSWTSWLRPQICPGSSRSSGWLWHPGFSLTCLQWPLAFIHPNWGHLIHVVSDLLPHPCTGNKGRHRSLLMLGLSPSQPALILHLEPLPVHWTLPSSFS